MTVSFIIHYFGWQARSVFGGIVRDGNDLLKRIAGTKCANDVAGPWPVSGSQPFFVRERTLASISEQVSARCMDLAAVV